MEEREEKWVEMYDYPKYEISDMGNVRNAKTEKNLAIIYNGKYNMVSVFDQGKVHTKRVGRFVYLSHSKEFCKTTVDHINRKSNDDRLENLRCVDMKTQCKNRTTRPVGSNVYNLTDKDKGYIIYSIHMGYNTTWTIMKEFGIPLNYMNLVIKRGSWEKYLSLVEEEDILRMKTKKILNDFERL